MVIWEVELIVVNCLKRESSEKIGYSLEENVKFIPPIEIFIAFIVYTLSFFCFFLLPEHRRMALGKMGFGLYLLFQDIEDRAFVCCRKNKENQGGV